MRHADRPGGRTDTVLTVNGREHRLAVAVQAILLDALRERLGLTGSKKGSDRGRCGAGTALVDGRRVLSCFVLAPAAQATEAATIEGQAGDAGRLHPMRRASLERAAYRCGCCTPGRILSAVARVAEGQAGADDEIRESRPERSAAAVVGSV